MNELIAILIQKLGLTAEEITDILWLALLQWQSTKTVSTEEQLDSTSVSFLDSSHDSREEQLTPTSASPLDSSPVTHLKTDKPDSSLTSVSPPND